MDFNQPGRQTYDSKWGVGRAFVSDDGSSLQFEPGLDAYALAWSTQGPAVPAIRPLLEREIALSEPESGLLIYGRSEKLMSDESWQEIWEKFARTREDKVISVSFSFPSRRIALVRLHPHYVSLGIAYIISHTNGQPLQADLHALIEAFAETAADCVRPHLDWALETVES